MSIDSNPKPDIVTLMMDFENGDLDEHQTIDLFQQLIDSGTVWKLQDFGRMVSELIRNGFCQLSEESHQDAYGNTVLSRRMLVRRYDSSNVLCVRSKNHLASDLAMGI
jgi:hypothetical protein